MLLRDSLHPPSTSPSLPPRSIFDRLGPPLHHPSPPLPTAQDANNIQAEARGGGGAGGQRKRVRRSKKVREQLEQQRQQQMQIGQSRREERAEKAFMRRLAERSRESSIAESLPRPPLAGTSQPLKLNRPPISGTFHLEQPQLEQPQLEKPQPKKQQGG